MKHTDPQPVAWDYYHKRLQGAPGETRHDVIWVANYTLKDGSVSGDLELVLQHRRAGRDNVEATIWLRPLYYGDDVPS